MTDFPIQGFALVPGVLSGGETIALRDALTAALTDANGSGSRHGENVYALRNVLALPVVRAVAKSPAVQGLAEAHIGQGAFAVRAILFDKTPDANWPVPWHQDLSIAVRERQETPGWGPWSEKAGVLHVQPPVALLERMVTLRIHLDDCDADNGPLRVLPGTHVLGRLDAHTIATLAAEREAVICTARAGDTLVMRPLLLHSSGKVTGSTGHRRVLHLEWAAEDLPGILEWQERV